MIDLWMFLTIAVIVWGVVEIIQSRIKAKKNKLIESNVNDTKKLEEKVDHLERRIGNLEAIVTDEDDKRFADESGNDLNSHDFNQTQSDQHGKLSNKLRR